jgi:hypothetical protein
MRVQSFKSAHLALTRKNLLAMGTQSHQFETVSGNRVSMGRLQGVKVYAGLPQLYVIHTSAARASHMIMVVQISVKTKLRAAGLDAAHQAMGRQEIQISIDGTQAYMGHFGAHAVVQLVGRGMRLRGTQRLKNDAPLGRHPDFF